MVTATAEGLLKRSVYWPIARRETRTASSTPRGKAVLAWASVCIHRVHARAGETPVRCFKRMWLWIKGWAQVRRGFWAVGGVPQAVSSAEGSLGRQSGSSRVNQKRNGLELPAGSPAGPQLLTVHHSCLCSDSPALIY